MTEKMEHALNNQLKEELYSAYLYLSMAAYFENMGLKGFAHWMEVQTKEELEHAQKFYEFINERGGRVKLQEIPAPKSHWDSPMDAFKDALEHEKYITTKIEELLKLAREENDYATEIFLHWFITEQVEEEANVSDVLSKFELIKDSPNGLFILDRELAKREE